MKKEYAVNCDLLQSIINKEQGKEWTGQTPFFNHCADLYNNSNKSDVYGEITGAIVGLRVKAGKVKSSVEAGRRGRAPGSKLSPEHKNSLVGANRKPRVKVVTHAADVKKEYGRIAEMKAAVSRMFSNPTLRNRIRVKCLDCCGGQRKEVALCTSYTCALYDVRPYKVKEKT